jgi:hypothetical protein
MKQIVLGYAGCALGGLMCIKGTFPVHLQRCDYWGEPLPGSSPEKFESQETLLASVVELETEKNHKLAPWLLTAA